jgi:hypothetical protein
MITEVRLVRFGPNQRVMRLRVDVVRRVERIRREVITDDSTEPHPTQGRSRFRLVSEGFEEETKTEWEGMARDFPDAEHAAAFWGQKLGEP